MTLSPQPGAKPARWLIAALAALAVHGLLALGLLLTPVATRPIEPPSVEISLFAPPDVARDQPPPQPRPLSQKTPLAVHRPPTTLPSPVEPSPLPAQGPPAQPAPSPSTERGPAPGPRFSGVQPTLKLDCIDRGPSSGASVYGKEACVRPHYPVPQGGGAYAGPVNPEWDRALQAKQSKHRPLPPPQPERLGCPGGNLGLGCSDDALVISTKKAF